MGVDGTGHDLKAFGSTSGSHLLWDESDNALRLVGADLVPASALSNRNKIINGDMRVSQRAQTYTFGSGGGTRYYVADRFWVGDFRWSAGSDLTVSRDDAVYPTGFSQSLKVASGGTGLTYSSAGHTGIVYMVEAQDLEPYYAETAMTLSFWCRSSHTGVFNVLIANGWWGQTRADRGLTKEFTISSADTWEQKTIEFSLAAGTAAGTWKTGTDEGLIFSWLLGANANRTGDEYLDTWANWVGYEVCTDNNIQLLTNANATFYLTGVQLEVGSNATPFEHRDIGSELARCQRYYYRGTPGSAYGTHAWGIANSTSTVVALMELPVTFRAGAHTLEYSGTTISNFGATNSAGGLALGSYQSLDRVQIDCGAAAGTPYTVGNPYGVRNHNDTAGYLGVSAEL